MNASIHTGIALSDRLTATQLAQTVSSGVTHARNAGLPDWMGAVDALIEEAVVLGACFSSGELSAILRTYRPDLVFSVVRDVGPHIRGRFQAGTLPAYAIGPVLQGTRTTLGYSHSPIGVEVNVYGPDERSIRTHLFEVEVPPPGGTIPDPSALPPAPVQSPVPVQQAPAALPARKRRASAPRRTRRSRTPARQRTTATVHVDRRLCVPRWAFQQLAAQQGAPLVGGDTVYVLQADGVATISREAVAGATPHVLVVSRGRLLFAAQGRAPFAPLAACPVTVTAAGIEIDLSAA